MNDTWKIIRQYAHDVRNSFNSLGLDAALLVELSEDAAMAESVMRIRAELRRLEDLTEALTLKFIPSISPPAVEDIPNIPPPSRVGTGAETVMVVDDRPENVQQLTIMLDSCGYSVLLAHSGEQALKHLCATTPDLILLDINMPGITGIELCRRLKQDAQWARVPVIFLSAENDKASIVEALESGGVDYVTKPFHKAELITRVRTHLALRRAEESAVRLAEDKDELLGILTHDLGNHLAGIHINAIVLEKQLADLPPQCGKFITNIARSTETTSNFVREFLANQSAERLQVQLSQCDLRASVEEAIERHTATAAAKGIALVVELPDHAVPAFADWDAVTRILDNLLSNAIKFSPPNSRVTVRARGTDLSVQDEGPGFTDEDRKKMFRRYGRLTAQPTGGEQSTGLGLTIIKRLVEAMNGSITVDSVAGKGARITVSLPHVHQQAAENC